MNNKRIHLILDIVLGIGILTLMNKQLFGLLYHEIAGTAVIIITLMHIIINLRSIRAMRRNFKKIPFNAKLCLIIDILLIAAFAWEGVSGVMISKKLFPGMSGNSFIFKSQHYFTAAIAIIMLGIHIGLHIGRRRIPTRLVVSILVISLICGGLGITQSGFTRWLTMPFSSAPEPHIPSTSVEGTPGDHDSSDSAEPDSTISESVSNTTERMTMSENGIDPSNQSDAQAGFNNGYANQEKHGSVPFYQSLWSILRYCGISSVIAMFTYMCMRRRKKQLRQSRIG